MKKSKTALHHKSATTSSTRLGDFPNRFRQHLSDQHYAATTIKTYMICLHSLAMRMEAKGISLRELDEVLAVKLMGRMRPDARYRTNGIFIVKRFVRFLNEQGAGKPPPPPTTDKSPWAQLRRDYDIYLRHQRGLSFCAEVEFLEIPLRRKSSACIKIDAARHRHLPAECGNTQETTSG